MSSESPAPIAASQQSISRRMSQRQALRRPPSRSAMSRSESNSLAASSAAASEKQPSNHRYSIHNDSSDDEIPVPMKLSALTKALLNDDVPESSSKPPSPPLTRRRSVFNGQSREPGRSSTDERRRLRSSSNSAENRQGSPSTAAPIKSRREDPSPPRKRVVRLSNTPNSLNQMSHHRRSNSVSRTATSAAASATTTSATASAVSSNSTSSRSRPTSRPASRDGSVDVKSGRASVGSSFSSSNYNSNNGHELSTPPASRVVRIANGASASKSHHSSRSSLGAKIDSSSPGEDHKQYEQHYEEPPATVGRTQQPNEQSSISRYPSRHRLEDNAALQSSMRVKRLGKIPGSFLSGPARRGRRRQSEEEMEPSMADTDMPPGGIPEDLEHNAQHGQDENMQDVGAPYYGNSHVNYASGSPPVRSREGRRPVVVAATPLSAPPRAASPKRLPEPQNHPRQPSRPERELFEAPTPAGGQENDRPSYLRSARKPSPLSSMVDKMADLAATPAHRDLSPDRKPLATVTHNTPHRPAPPPPPQMSALAAATSSAATAPQAKQRRNVIKVNGKIYTRLDCLGRGGSAKVYRVTAENGKMWALKRVALEHADDMTIKGYRGEIDLLRKLDAVDRVIMLLDYEMNTEKQVLTLVMEMGELDMNVLLKSRQGHESATLDPVFVRFYWKEMLECVQAVHEFDIVHSDLKPANFVLVQGRLKLIDFGIANAIQTDETVNVHREAQIGTPNYMSPESLMDFNAPRGSRVPGRPKLMKLGKPSDVWSLGCILYQLVYGYPPFGHIANQMARCQAIINWDHVIEFPSHGMGDVLVPPSLIRTMRRCLQRDAHMRPTCAELLDPTDPFMYPVEMSDKLLPLSEEMLGRIIHSVVMRCKERLPTDAEMMSVWPAAYWSSVKKAMSKAQQQQQERGSS
ncbi:Serine/threonine-protein kinase MPS1 [Ceratocystis fimbriata CBS 114723]|uniref:Serine/threonine-protein kinase MPS1 n=1 Tax=Ceratocystis fimbriata CBS 114723 TaxID=1035309 RepID=A0A2C5WID3_9PEZI|nr:Serine/threonine-protein kinase MPS1 [Ceratocystis fimbriata CBS 114723]